MRFRLSTLLWAISFAAVLFAWYVEHSSRNRREIVGTWQAEPEMLGYYSTLEIRPGGTFRKSQGDRFTTDVFTGDYTATPDGHILFHVKSKTTESILSEANDDYAVPPEKLNDVLWCRCAIDKTGHLVIGASRHMSGGSEGARLQWETYYQPR